MTERGRRSGMRVLVTGTAGFVGAAVEVLGREHWLRCVDIAPTSEADDGESVGADLASYAAAVAAVEGVECVVHLAAVAGGPELFASPDGSITGTIVATANLLEAARQA